MRQINRMTKFLATDSTGTSFTAPATTKTRPSGNGVLDLTGFTAGGPSLHTAIAPSWVKFTPYATAGDNDTFDMRVIGWHRIGGTDAPGTVEWMPLVLGQFTCTLSASVGVAGGYIVNTERFADTIVNHATISTAMERLIGTDSGGAQTLGGMWISSPANDLIGSIEMRLKGAELLELHFDSTAAGTTAMNCLYGFIDENDW